MGKLRLIVLSLALFSSVLATPDPDVSDLLLPPTNNFSPSAPQSAPSSRQEVQAESENGYKYPKPTTTPAPQKCMSKVAECGKSVVQIITEERPKVVNVPQFVDKEYIVPSFNEVPVDVPSFQDVPVLRTEIQFQPRDVQRVKVQTENRIVRKQVPVVQDSKVVVNTVKRNPKRILVQKVQFVENRIVQKEYRSRPQVQKVQKIQYVPQEVVREVIKYNDKEVVVQVPRFRDTEIVQVEYKYRDVPVVENRVVERPFQVRETQVQENPQVVIQEEIQYRDNPVQVEDVQYQPNLVIQKDIHYRDFNVQVPEFVQVPVPVPTFQEKQVQVPQFQDKEVQVPTYERFPCAVKNVDREYLPPANSAAPCPTCSQCPTCQKCPEEEQQQSSGGYGY